MPSDCDCQIDIIVESEITAEVSPESEVTVIVSTEGEQGPPGAGVDLVAREAPSGSRNGSNVTFASAYDFVPETVVVDVNGLLQTPVTDYVTSGVRTVILAVAPLSGEVIHIAYRKAT